MNKSDGPIATLATYPSSSNPNKSYTLTLGGDQVVYCSCPPWKFQKGVLPKDRKPCKHIAAWRAGQ